MYQSIDVKGPSLMVRVQSLNSSGGKLPLLPLLSDWYWDSPRPWECRGACGWPAPPHKDASAPPPAFSPVHPPPQLWSEHSALSERERSAAAQGPASRLCAASFHLPLHGPRAQKTVCTALALAYLFLRKIHLSKDKKHKWSPVPFGESIHRTNLI